ncbi:MAG: triose-phosphate isomerase [Alphaproteobacteria bacterium]
MVASPAIKNTAPEKKLIVGNWKMNGLRHEGCALAEALVKESGTISSSSQLVVCPPFTLLPLIADIIKGSNIFLGGQDCHTEHKGAFTSSISADMLEDAGCSYVILGHSERRHQKGETDAMVVAKASAAQAANLIPLICVGETEQERDSGLAQEIVGKQLAWIARGLDPYRIAISYEPVWAIGTGRTASDVDIEDMHRFIRQTVSGLMRNGAAIPLLYGGSVKASNAGNILTLPSVDGVLVGGASLVAADFVAIANSVTPAMAKTSF